MASEQEQSQGSPTSSGAIRVTRTQSFGRDGQDPWAAEEYSEEDFSDPEDTPQPSPANINTAQSLTADQERTNIMRDIIDPNKYCKNLEDFKARYEERLRRHCGPDENDKNRTIFHWLPSKLWEGMMSEDQLEWLVTTVIACNPLIIRQRTNDVEKSNCLHVALEAKRPVLARLICEQSLGHPKASLAVREVISQGNEYKENPLHLAILQDEPNFKLIQILVENSTKEAISMQRHGRTLGNKTENLNTPLHDLVHVDRVFNGGYMKVLMKTVEKDPEALSVSNEAGETPFQFHISTRNRRNGQWAGLEFAKPKSSAARRGKKGDSTTALEMENSEDRIVLVGSYLLDQCCSQLSYEEACTCLYGDSKISKSGLVCKKRPTANYAVKQRRSISKLCSSQRPR